MAKKYKRETIALDGQRSTVLIVRPSGELPYLYFAEGRDGSKLVGWLDSVPKVRKLRRLCDEYLTAREKADG